MQFLSSGMESWEGNCWPTLLQDVKTEASSFVIDLFKEFRLLPSLSDEYSHCVEQSIDSYLL